VVINDIYLKEQSEIDSLTLNLHFFEILLKIG